MRAGRTGRALALLFVSVCAAAGARAQDEGRAQIPASLPVRLLPISDPFAPRLLFELEFPRDLGSLLEVDGREPALRAVDPTGGGRPGERAAATLVCLFDVPSGHVPIVEYGFADPLAAPQPLVIPISAPPARHLPGGPRSLAAFAHRFERDAAARHIRRWIETHDSPPTAPVRGSGPTFWTRSELPAASAPLRCAAAIPPGKRVPDRIRISSRPSRGAHADFRPVRSGEEAVSRVDAVLDGEWRPAVRVAPGASATFPLPRTASAPTSVTWGVAIEPGEDDLDSKARYAVAIESASGESVEVLRETLCADAGKRYADRSAAWPGQLASPSRLRFENLGALPVLFAQPMLRGTPDRRRSNLLLISIDTLRADHLGCYGYERPTSPFLDRLAADAVFFRDCTAAASLTLPSHATLLTGLLPPRHGALSEHTRLDALCLPYLPRLLAESGYATAAFTGGGYVSEDFGFHVGFDRFSTADPMAVREGLGLRRPAPRASPRSLDDVADWIERRGEEPWMVFVHTYAVHDYFAPADLVERFDRGAASRFREPLAPLPTPWIGDSDPPGDDDARYLADLYDASVAHVDRSLSRFFDRLESRRILDRTVVVVTSDHGEEFLDHGRLGHGATLYQEQLRVPLIVRVPGVAPAVVREPIHHADLVPTLLQILCRSAPRQSDGRDRSRDLVGSGESAPSLLFAHVSCRDGELAALRIGPWKLVRSDGRESLFHLRSDPQEHEDRSESDPGRRQRMSRELTDLQVRLRGHSFDPLPASLSEEIERQLREAGYLGGGR